jgi:hypothetical protein
MKKLFILFGICLLISLNAYPQSLRSLRNKLENAIIDEAIDNMFEDDDENSDQNASPEATDSSKPDQKSGSSGLDNSLDDVPEALAQASTEFSGKEYHDARTSLRKALKTLDIKIGQQILASLPETVKELTVKTESDRVTSETSSWAGLSIHREYEKNDSWAGITIYNSSMAGMAKTAVGMGLYSTYSEDDENQKSIQIKGNEAVITFSDSEGYSVSVSIGQQTFVLVEGVNISSESEMIAIAESFDYNFIKKSLGDQ